MYKLTRAIFGFALALTLMVGQANSQTSCTATPPAAAPAQVFSGDPPSDSYKVMYHSMWEFVRDNYFDPSRLKDFDKLEHAYDDKLGTMNDMQLALKLMTAATHDKWTVFISPTDMRNNMLLGRQGKVIGGLMLYRHGSHYRLDVIHYGSAAYGTALRERDDVVCLNKVAIDGLDAEQVDTLLRGNSGDKLLVTAISADDGSEYEVELTLKTPPSPTVTGEVLPGTNTIYLRMPSFDGEQFVEAFIAKFDELNKSIGGKADGLVIDLRNNLGGEMPAAVKFSSLFLNEGLIVTKSIVRGNAIKDVMVMKADEIVVNKNKVDEKIVGILRGLPIKVLANGSSASAAEITLGALKDNKRGTVIGVTSFGKGVGYKVQPGPVGGLLSLTSLKYVTPTGTEVHEVGITPDVEVKVGRAEKNDVQLAEAVRQLNEMKNTKSTSAITSTFDGKALYKQVFEQIRDRHLTLKDPVLRKAWEDEWAEKFAQTAKLDTEEGTDEAIKEMTASLHLPFDMYFGKDFAQVTEKLDHGGASTGISLRDRIVLSIDKNTGVPKRERVVYITGVRDDGPAFGVLEAGDYLIKVGCESVDPEIMTGCADVSTLSMKDIELKTYGKEGSQAIVSILRSSSDGTSKEMRLAVVRKILHQKVVFVEKTENGTALIRIKNFMPADFELQLETALRQVGDQNAIIIDVRDNPGGRTDASVNAVSMVMKKGLINVTNTRLGDILVRNEVSVDDNYLMVKTSRGAYGLPMPLARPALLVKEATKIVVLTNNRSMSAAEIFAGALKANGRAVVVGETTYGKGVGQDVIMGLMYGRRLHVTAFEFLPGGVAHNHVGIAPDIAADGDVAQIVAAEKVITPGN